MKLLIIPLALIAMAPVDPAPEIKVLKPVANGSFAPKPDCDEDVIHLADRRETVAPQRLGDLPSARVESAVWYHEDGCTVPVIVKQDVER